MATSSEPSDPRDHDADLRLVAIATDLLRLAPPIPVIMSGLAPGPWADDLRALVRPLAQAWHLDIEAIIAQRFRNSEPMSQFYEKYRRMPIELVVQISASAAASASSAPVAAFILTTLCLFLIAGQLEALQTSGSYPHHTRWYEVSYNCVATALRVGSLWPARRLIDFTYSVLDATRITLRHEVEPELARCRALARELERKIEIAVSNLADDLRDSCRPGEPNFRAETGAMAWTLGMVPESAIFRAGSAAGDAVPSRRFFRQLVRHSLVCMPTDALLQHVWLQMKIVRRSICGHTRCCSPSSTTDMPSRRSSRRCTRHCRSARRWAAASRGR